MRMLFFTKMLNPISFTNDYPLLNSHYSTLIAYIENCEMTKRGSKKIGVSILSLWLIVDFEFRDESKILKI